MDAERLRAELRRLLDELPEDRRDVWRATTEDIAGAYGALKAELADLRAASMLAEAIRESTAALAAATEVIRDARAELSRRLIIPDAATWAKIGTGVAAIIGPIVAAIAYLVSGGTTPPPTLPLPGVPP